MCGICGFFSPTLEEDISSLVSAMNQGLVHRGPDDAGYYYSKNSGFAMRRLSIIDLGGGHQPIFNETKELCIVFNGEIYNFQTVRAMLLQRGHRFQTNSDTECIIHLYEDEEERTPEFLNGMFAFCIYDHRSTSLFIARDRFGEKPLFYYHHPQHGFAFSSEIKSLLECGKIPRKIDYEALGYYLRTGFVPAPLTMFQNIRVLPPGCWLKYKANQLTIGSYYSINYAPDPHLDCEDTAIEVVRDSLREAVKRQSISDVALGAFLSGGIDSSSVVAMLQSISTQPIKTFTMRFSADGYDESPIAREVAKHIGTEHHEFVVPNIAFTPDDLWRIVDHVGQPFADTSAIPTYILSRHIQREVTVALSGDGGDEMFAGYPVFQWGHTIRRMQKLPPPLIRASDRIVTALCKHSLLSNNAKLRQVRRGLSVASEPFHLLPVALHSLFEPVELQTLLHSKFTLAIATGNLPLLTDLPAEAETWSPLRQLMYYRLKHDLPNDMLTKVDRMNMAASLEVRSPMLDVDLAELSMRLPDRHLIQNGIGKSILRKAIKGMVPDAVFNHPKTGFSIPLHKYQNDFYKNLVGELLGSRQDVTQLFLQQELVQIIQRGLHQQIDNAQYSTYRASHQLWAILQLAAWIKCFNVSL